jgi:hypothetical protein
MTQQLHDLATRLVARGKGILAAPDENLTEGAQAIGRRARCNSAASTGAYTEELEQAAIRQ